MFILLDAILGTVVTFYFGSALPNYSDFEGILKVVLELLLKLLDWLSGAPAGLKLNAPLNNVFHSFYSYHLHLWEGYTGNYIKITVKYVLSILLRTLRTS